MCGFGGSFGEDVRAVFSFCSERKTSVLYLSGSSVRNGDSDLDFAEVHGPCGRLIGPGRV